ncbi:hypothetical protein BZA05DRAFT_253337 [Tricharina praecox]|uniref:uncharacterized protein n=1 Tax=Tricharina praecox TaxID=43433 RepID=UPI00221F4DA8|nr:uncharacterized protein BZA05DRAFT_253337 [Tricharina praecox]KAI5854912.1 hypothetical protein BZA05DRAFT_253337 [Tricharina praecox]
MAWVMSSVGLLLAVGTWWWCCCLLLADGLLLLLAVVGEVLMCWWILQRGRAVRCMSSRGWREVGGGQGQRESPRLGADWHRDWMDVECIRDLAPSNFAACMIRTVAEFSPSI